MQQMAIAGPSTVVTEAGARIARDGGNAVDTAIVSALTAMCTEPGVCAPLGGGYLTVDLPGSHPVVIDGYLAVPGIGCTVEPRMREVEMAYGGGMRTLVGPGSIAVPGSFAGMELASAAFGAAPWAELMEAVAVAVESGFPLGKATRSYLAHAGEPVFSDDPAARAALYDGSRLRDTGEIVEFEGLADTLRHIGEEGARTLYEGDLARLIVEDLADRGGQLTRVDLAGYRAVARNPLNVEMNGWSMQVNPPPAVGGVAMTVALTEIAGAESGGPAAWVDALVTAFTTRSEELEAHDRVADAAQGMLMRAGIRSPSTISVAVAAEDGSAVAGTFSAGYGSGVIPAGTGMLTNNTMGEIELRSDRGDQPGERMMSNMAPTVARRGGDVVAIGSPGADRITSALVVTMEWLMAGMGLAEAIEHPRVHPEIGEWGIRVAAEPGLDLEDVPYPIRQFESRDMFFGGVIGAAREGGELHGHVDSRRGGSVRVL